MNIVNQIDIKFSLESVFYLCGLRDTLFNRIIELSSGKAFIKTQIFK